MAIELILAVLGSLAGLLAGLLGIGGGVVTLAGCQVASMANIWPVGTTFASFTGLSAMQSAMGASMAAFVHWRGGHLQPKMAFPIAGCAMVGSYAGGLLSGNLSNGFLAQLYAALLVLMLVILVRRPNQRVSQRIQAQQRVVAQPETDPPLNEPHLHETGTPLPYRPSPGVLSIAALVGGLSGILGIGGSVFMIPVLAGIVGLPTRWAIGCSSLMAACVGWAATVAKFQAGLVEPFFGFIIGLSAMGGSFLGAKWMPYWSTWALRGLLMLVMLWALGQTVWGLLNHG